MKGFINIKKVPAVAFAALVSLMLTACTKDPSMEEVGIRLKFINTSPDAAPVQYKLNGENAHTPALAFGDTTAYLPFTGGTYSLVVGVGATEPINTVIDFTPKTNYSLLVVDSAKRLKVTVIKDDLTLPAIPLRAKVRFFNLSPTAGTLALRAATNTDTVTISADRTFNDVAEAGEIATFQLLPSNVYELLLYSGATIVAKLPAQPLLNYKIYTIYAKGIQGGTGNQALSIGVISHN